MLEDSDIDIRPIFEMEDFAEFDPSGEIAALEESQRDRLATKDALVQPYLFFSGRCEEALEFYEEAIGAQVTAKLKFNESPEPMPEGMLQPGFEDKVMHSSFTIGNMTLMASDGCDDKSSFDGFRLSLSVPTEEECDRVFNALAEGGQIDVPLAKTFFSPRYGQVTDKFAVGWMVMVLDEPV